MTRVFQLFAGAAALANLFNLSQARAETVVEERMRSVVRMNALNKLTAGPQDNYQAVVAPDESKIFFTRNTNLASQLFEQPLKTALSLPSALVSKSFDTRDPAVSPDGKAVAFTSFENNARGGICYLYLDSPQKINCIKTSKDGAEQPTWVGDHGIVYIEHAENSDISRLVAYDIGKAQTKTIFADTIVAYTISPDGRTIVYSSSQKVWPLTSIPRVLKIRNSNAISSVKVISIDLPGTSGFPRFDGSGRWLYFSQFFADTNHDAIIDASDNSVIFRIDSSKLAASSPQKPVLPEQITSAENNCNYISPAKNNLYVTCAFEDSLDIYRLPNEGSIPASWTESQLWDAHRVARTTAERILTLNTLRFRFPKTESNLLPRIFSNHFTGKEFAAALYYLDVLQKSSNINVTTTDLSLLRSYLQVAQKEFEQPLGRPTTTFLKFVASTRGIVHAMHGATPAHLQLLDSFFLDIENQGAKALVEFEKINPKQITSPFFQFLYGDIGERLFNKAKASHELWENMYRALANSKELAEEPQSYYSLLYLFNLESTYPDYATRLSVIQKNSPQPDDSVFSLFLQAEVLALKTALVDDPKLRAQTFRALDEFIGKVKTRYFLTRGLYIRALAIFSERNLEDQLNDIAHKWLSNTKTKEAEFIYARDQYVAVRLDKAYAFLHENKTKAASDVLYTLLRVTDDPEAHVEYYKTMKAQKKDEDLQKTYDDLVKQNFIGGNIALYQALKDLEPAENNINAAIESLNGETGPSYNPAIREFLSGYAYYQKILAGKKGLEFDVTSAEQAHRHFTIALDLAQGNKRVRAAILYNLGLLHFTTRNFGNAVSFLQLRARLPFADENEQLDYLWLLSRAQFYNRTPQEAFVTASEGLTLAHKLKKLEVPFLERVAFYAMSAGNYTGAVSQYSELLKHSSLPPATKMKAHLARGFSYFKLSQKNATADLTDALKMLDDANLDLGSASEVIQGHKERVRIVVLGLLAEADSTHSVSYRTQRYQALLAIESDLKKLSMRKEDWRDNLLRDCNAITAAALMKKDSTAALENQMRCEGHVEDNYDPKSDAADLGLYQDTYNALFLAAAKRSTQESFLKSRERANTLIEKLEPLTQGNKAISIRWAKLKSEAAVFDARAQNKQNVSQVFSDVQEHFKEEPEEFRNFISDIVHSAQHQLKGESL